MPNNWLELLKAGDMVIVVRGRLHRDAGEKVCTVERETATQVTSDGQRFLRSTGRAIGMSGWIEVYLAEATRERLGAARDDEKRRNLLARIKATRFTELSLASLENIVAALPEGTVSP